MYYRIYFYYVIIYRNYNKTKQITSLYQANSKLQNTKKKKIIYNQIMQGAGLTSQILIYFLLIS